MFDWVLNSRLKFVDLSWSCYWLKFYLPQQAQALKQEYINSGKLSMKWENIRTCRSSRPEVFCKKGVLRNLAKFTGKHLCQSLFFKKVAGLRPETLLKKRLWHGCFPVNFVELLRTPFFKRTPLDDCFWKSYYWKHNGGSLKKFKRLYYKWTCF